MTGTRKTKTAFERLLDYVTRLQGVSNGLAAELKKILDDADAETLDVLKKNWVDGDGDIKKTVRNLQKVVDAIKKARSKKLAEAEKIAVVTCKEVADASSDEAAREMDAAAQTADREERRRRFKKLSDEKVGEILNYSPYQGASIKQWFKRWEENDLRRITDAVQTGAIEQLSVAEITRKIRGTKENNYKDGILETSKNSAGMISRTLINGVSNAVRMETFLENDDVLDGIQFLATLDGKTSYTCAALDGHVWKGEQMKGAPRPPLHPNCRSTIIPYIELTDKDGNRITDEELGVTRPAANADFEDLAEKAYNKAAKEKKAQLEEKARQRGDEDAVIVVKKWKDLAPSTREKYYYQAQRDWEKEHDQPAYRQEPASLTFKDYFEKQPDEFKLSWLGRDKFEAYQAGEITPEQLSKPSVEYFYRAQDLISTIKDVFSLPKKKQSNSNLRPLKQPRNAENLLNYYAETLRRIAGQNKARKTFDADRKASEESKRARKIWAEKVIPLRRKIHELKEAHNNGQIDDVAFEKNLNTLTRRHGDALARWRTLNPEKFKYAKDREFVKKIFGALFPDNGGGAYFTTEERDLILKAAKTKREKKQAIEVLDFYDIISKSKKLKKRGTLEEVVVEKMPPGRLGSYSEFYRRIKLSSNDSSRFTKTIAHELGHFVEDVTFEHSGTNKVLEWLKKESREKWDNKKKDYAWNPDPDENLYGYGFEKNPTLLARSDGYSHRVYEACPAIGNNPQTLLEDSNGNFIYKQNTEVVSTGFEYLFLDPLSFARNNPKHFNLILELLDDAGVP